MKKLLMVLLIAGAIAAGMLVWHYFQQSTVVIGDYTVLYHPNQCDIPASSFPKDLEELKKIPCVIRITWQVRIAHDMFEEYCYLPGRGTEKSRTLHTK